MVQFQHNLIGQTKFDMYLDIMPVQIQLRCIHILLSFLGPTPPSHLKFSHDLITIFRCWIWFSISISLYPWFTNFTLPLYFSFSNESYLSTNHQGWSSLNMLNSQSLELKRLWFRYRQPFYDALTTISCWCMVCETYFRINLHQQLTGRNIRSLLVTIIKCHLIRVIIFFLFWPVEGVLIWPWTIYMHNICVFTYL